MNYWLSSTGRVIACRLGGHMEKAIDLVFEKYEKEAVEKGILDKHGCLNTGADIIGFIESKGWIRYEDWTGNPRWLIWNRRPTKKQIEMMFKLTGHFYEDKN
jgi:hypothetical protein